MSYAKETKISYAELLAVIPADKLRLIEQSTWCPNCREQTSIAEYENSIYRNDLSDTILQGKCIRCGGAVGRYIETGDEQAQT